MRLYGRNNQPTTMTIKEKVRTHIFVSGMVQGVGFRATVARRAEELGVGGWVRNNPDGRVEAVFEGEKEKIEEIIKWLQQGSGFPGIREVEVWGENFRGEFDNFYIKYD